MLIKADKQKKEENKSSIFLPSRDHQNVSSGFISFQTFLHLCILYKNGIILHMLFCNLLFHIVVLHF